jgi:hypothetical protein
VTTTTNSRRRAREPAPTLFLAGFETMSLDRQHRFHLDDAPRSVAVVDDPDALRPAMEELWRWIPASVTGCR